MESSSFQVDSESHEALFDPFSVDDLPCPEELVSESTVRPWKNKYAATLISREYKDCRLISVSEDAFELFFLPFIQSSFLSHARCHPRSKSSLHFFISKHVSQCQMAGFIGSETYYLPIRR